MAEYKPSHLSTAVLKFMPVEQQTKWTMLGQPTNEEDFKKNCQLVSGVDSDGNNIYMDPEDWPSGFTWANIKAEHDKNVAGDNIRILRGQRNEKLAESDWMANSDVTMSDDWKTYRQALRDLPANTTDAANPTWPTPPS
tara:strand:- start:3 stop:419 length:417 start_codon:yes stop_codon:yes gene_type:complete